MTRLKPTMRPTIRTRLTFAAAAATIVMLTIASLTLVSIQRRSLTNGIDESLRQTADNLLPLEPGTGDLPPAGDPEDTFLQILDRDGQVVAATPNVPGEPAITPRPDDLHSETITSATIQHPSGRFRILLRPLKGNDETNQVLIVGKNLDDVTESIQALIVALAVVSPALILLLAGLSWWLIGRTLRPVDDIQREVQSIGGRELHRRVPVPDTDDEIATLAHTMNAMLARVQDASDQQQQFVDDASHELRTPLTRMIADLDVALAHPDQENPGETLRRIHEGATDLHRLLEDLLFLARSSHTRSVPTLEVDLDDVVLGIAAQARTTSGVDIDTSGVEAAPTRGDSRALTRAIGNIVSNATRHARSTVSVTARTDGMDSLLVVDDDGEGIPADDRLRVFERFTRLDEARGRDDGGAGLGLAIAREIIDRHGRAITISDSPGGGARVSVSLPAVRHASSNGR